MKKVKQIHAICNPCAAQLYPPRMFGGETLENITIAIAQCDVCGIKRGCTPVRDYRLAVGSPDLSRR